MREGKPDPELHTEARPMSIAETRPAPEDLPPDLADHPDYEVVRELGRGGMGVVYLARNRLMGRPEVLKVVSGHLLDRGIVRERFLREIRNAAQLHHPNIVTAYSAVRAGDRIVLAMEYVEGENLADLVRRRGPLSVAHASHFTYQAALGLQHAHERGMVHRDIKPGNLMLARQGSRATVKILDFGLARATQEAPIDGGLTREGQMLGTPDYIAPEQSLDAKKADIRADIYSLGCTLYFLLTGKPPFDAHSLYEILQAHHSRDATPLNLACPDVPTELAVLVAKMMAKEPGHRFQTPGEVAQALRPFFRPGEEPRVAPSPVVAPNVAEKPSVASLPSIDLGHEENLSPSRPTTTPTTKAGPPWPWITAGAGVMLAGLIVSRFVLNRPEGSPVGPPPASASTSPVVRRPTPPRNDPRPERPAVPRIAEESTEPGPIAPAPRPVERGSDRIVASKPRSDPAVASPAPPPSPPPTPAPAIVAAKEPIAKKAPPAPAPPDFRLLAAIAAPVLPRAQNLEPPRLVFWPALRPDKTTYWQVGDPDRIAMDQRGVQLSAGPGGNLLLTRQEFAGSCTMKITLQASKGTEAFLALRAHRGPEGWKAITSRIYEKDGKIHAGFQATDFQKTEVGAKVEIAAPDASIRITFDVNPQSRAQIVTSHGKTSTASYAKTPAADYRGVAGIFVKSGTVLIHAVDIQE